MKLMFKSKNILKFKKIIKIYNRQIYKFKIKLSIIKHNNNKL